MRTRSRTPSGQLVVLDPPLGGDRPGHRVVRGREDEEHTVAFAAHRPAPVLLEGALEHAVVHAQQEPVGALQLAEEDRRSLDVGEDERQAALGFFHRPAL